MSPQGWHHADPGVRVRKTRALGSDQDVAVQGEFEPTGHGDAVDGSDQSLVQGRERSAGESAPGRQQVEVPAGGAQLLKVEASAEGWVGSGQDDDVDVERPGRGPAATAGARE